MIPDFLLDFNRACVIECKPASSIEELDQYRKTLILKMPEWLEDDVLRELRALSQDSEADPLLQEESAWDLQRILMGKNPRGWTRRVLVAGSKLYSDTDKVSIDGTHFFCLCSGQGDVDHVGLSIDLGSHCLVCGLSAEAWVDKELILQTWREVCSSQQWMPKRKRRKR